MLKIFTTKKSGEPENRLRNYMGKIFLENVFTKIIKIFRLRIDSFKIT